MKIFHSIQAFFFFCMTAIVRLLPLGWARSFGKGLGNIAYSFLTSRRKVTISNLHYAYPEMSESEVITTARSSFRSVGEASLELGWLSRLTPGILMREMILTNPEDLEKELEKGKGVVIVVSHYAGWEFVLQGIHQYAPGRTHVVYKPLSNSSIDAIVLAWRTRLGLMWIPLESAVEDTMNAVKNGDVVILAADQSVGPESVWTSFFGREVPTAKGPAALCLKTGAALYLSAVRRKPDGTCSGPLIKVRSADLKGYNQSNMKRLTQRLTSLTEEYIRKDPGQWMWTHKRWKHTGKKEVRRKR